MTQAKASLTNTRPGHIQTQATAFSSLAKPHILQQEHCPRRRERDDIPCLLGFGRIGEVERNEASHLQPEIPR